MTQFFFCHYALFYCYFYFVPFFVAQYYMQSISFLLIDQCCELMTKYETLKVFDMDIKDFFL